MTKRRLVLVMSVLALIAILGVAAVGTALAQTTTPPAAATPDTEKTEKLGRSLGFGFLGFGRGGDTANFDAVAEALDLTPTQLFEELHAGKTLSEIAEAQGVDLSAVQEAMKAARIQAMKDKIAQAVTDGKITQEQADWLLQGIEKGWGFGFDGFGLRGRGGMRGMHGHPFGNQDSSQPAPSTSARGTSS